MLQFEDKVFVIEGRGDTGRVDGLDTQEPYCDLSYRTAI